MKLSALILMPIGGLAIPASPMMKSVTTLFAKRYDDAVFAPGSNPYDICSGHHKNLVDTGHAVNFDDCVDIMDWAKSHNGEFVLKFVTDPGDDTEWHVLKKNDNCALLARNVEVTSVGNADMYDLLNDISQADGSQGEIEEKGGFTGCQQNATVSFWLRNAEGI
ncbi:hypothetical protein F5Y15DRAFT_254919 [Xylariaceae sp. FL0016]|nr:hypothetical protein F5Y15DRAFT_254919 [Xylariaceae sp. FL0016]